LAVLTPEQRKLFEEPNLCAVSTLGSDGGPRVTMVWVDIDDQERLVVNSAEHRDWPKNLARDPRVGLCVFDRDNWVRNVTVVGRVVETTTVGAWEHIQHLAEKYGKAPYKGATDRVVFRIEIERAKGYGV
jgi:PPOX class probable F420-dependent enzyme